MRIQLNPQRDSKAFILQCALALVVLAVGAVAVYKLVQWCNKIPPPNGSSGNEDTNATEFVQSQSNALYQTFNAGLPQTGFVAPTNCDCACQFSFTYVVTTSFEMVLNPVGTLPSGGNATVAVVIERSQDLQVWTPIMTNQTAIGQVAYVIDAAAPCSGSAFYRGVLNP